MITYITDIESLRQLTIYLEEQEMLLMFKNELDRCKASSLYMYNNYIIINGKSVNKLTQKEWNDKTDTQLPYNLFKNL